MNLDESSDFDSDIERLEKQIHMLTGKYRQMLQISYDNLGDIQVMKAKLNNLGGKIARKSLKLQNLTRERQNMARMKISRLLSAS